jgi:hypothetical protein
LQQKQRGLDLVEIGDRRSRFIDLAVGHRLAEKRFHILLQSGIGLLQQAQPIDDPVFGRGRGPDLRSFANRQKRHVSAVRLSGDADLARIGIPARHQKLRGVDLILQIASAEVLDVGFLESDPVPRRTAHVERDADEAAGSQCCGKRVETVHRLTGHAAG